MCKWFCQSLDPRPQKTQETLEDVQKTRRSQNLHSYSWGHEFWFEILKKIMLIITILSTRIDHLFYTFNHEHWLWDRTRLMSPLWKCQVSLNLIQPMEQCLSLRQLGKLSRKMCVCVCGCVCACVWERERELDWQVRACGGQRPWHLTSLQVHVVSHKCQMVTWSKSDKGDEVERLKQVHPSLPASSLIPPSSPIPPFTYSSHTLVGHIIQGKYCAALWVTLLWE